MCTTKNVLKYYSVRLIRFSLYRNILSLTQFYLLKIFVLIFVSRRSDVVCKTFCSILNGTIHSVPAADLFEKNFDLKAGALDLCRLLQELDSDGLNGKCET